jgi:3-oxoacyl-[acyl-carrier-protein] synthase II
MTKKIVVTGIGATSPLGGTAQDSWKALLAGESGIRPIEADWVEKYDLPVTFAGQAKVRPEEVLERVEYKRLDPSAQYALISAREAWADAGFTADSDIDPTRVGVDYSTGIGGLWTLLDAWDTLKEKGPRRVLPMTIPMLMPNAAAAAISMSIPSRAYARTDVSACASSTEAIANAYDHIQQGLADVVLAGGTEAVVHPLPIAAFAAMQALSKRNDDPATASRPFDVTRDGFVLGEGAGTIVMESEEHALARGARIYAEVAGGSVTSDSYHITAPDPEGNAAARAMKNALEQAGARPEDVNHVNAHATSTPVGDVAEYKSLLRVFGDHLPNIAVSATKAATGHLLGGTGALEAIFTILALHNRTAPPTINLTEQDPAIILDVVTAARSLGDGPLLALSNSFGFGGHNAVAAFRSY